MLADAPIGIVDWCQIYQAQMITALSSEPARNFWLPAEILKHAQQVRGDLLLTHHPYLWVVSAVV